MLHKPVDALAIGETVPTRGRTVTETDVVSFCYLTGNWLEIHSNEQVAARTPYGRRLVQGSLVFSIIPGLVTWDARYTIAMYAVDDMRFPRPSSATRSARKLPSRKCRCGTRTRASRPSR